MFELALPAALLVLPLPFLVWMFMPRAEPIFFSALKVPFYDALGPALHHSHVDLICKKYLYLLGLIWVLLVLAVAGPRWVGQPVPLTREGRNIMLTLDLSGSMALDDMVLHGRRATRLAVVKKSAKDFVAARTSDRIGLILFATRAYMQTPLTYDHQNVLARIDDATVGLAGQSTSIGDALGLAVKRFQSVPAEGRVIILLTDGANNSGILTPLKAAQLAKMDHIKIYTIGLGSDNRAADFGGLLMGLNPEVDLDEGTLKQIAEKTGGRYFYANDPKSLERIYQKINQLEIVKQDASTIRPQQEYYPWLLAMVCLLWAWLFLTWSGLLRFYGSRRQSVEHWKETL